LKNFSITLLGEIQVKNNYTQKNNGKILLKIISCGSEPALKRRRITGAGTTAAKQRLTHQAMLDMLQRNVEMRDIAFVTPDGAIGLFDIVEDTCAENRYLGTSKLSYCVLAFIHCKKEDATSVYGLAHITPDAFRNMSESGEIGQLVGSMVNYTISQVTLMSYTSSSSKEINYIEGALQEADLDCQIIKQCLKETAGIQVIPPSPELGMPRFYVVYDLETRRILSKNSFMNGYIDHRAGTLKPLETFPEEDLRLASEYIEIKNGDPYLKRLRKREQGALDAKVKKSYEIDRLMEAFLEGLGLLQEDEEISSNLFETYCALRKELTVAEIQEHDLIKGIAEDVLVLESIYTDFLKRSALPPS
jgi:hypothetical protein